MALTLVIGNKNYSSWSLRPWLAMRIAGLGFDEIRIPLDRPETKTAILKLSPNGRVPCLHDGDLRVWDSLAICEYVNERYAEGRLWPADVVARAHARSIVAEMHAGFAAVRKHLPMDIRSQLRDRGRAALQQAEVAAEVARIHAIWTGALGASKGPFLFGEFSIADAFYAPVVTRFATYNVPLAPALAAYSEQILGLAPMQAWVEAARAEVEVLAND